MVLGDGLRGKSAPIHINDARNRRNLSARLLSLHLAVSALVLLGDCIDRQGMVLWGRYAAARGNLALLFVSGVAVLDNVLIRAHLHAIILGHNLGARVDNWAKLAVFDWVLPTSNRAFCTA